MNKIVVLLAVVVIITLGALFFCAGFLTGTKINLPTPMTKLNNSNAVSMDEIKKVVSPESASLSEKILNLISTASEGTSHEKSSSKSGQESISNKLSVDNLIREIIADHAEEDDCSVNKTISEIEHAKKINDQPLLVGRKIVFVGYFKNKIALEIQELLTSRGYKAHVEHSKTAPGEESFIFCGPFKKSTTADTLANWLNTNGFKEAKVVNIAKEDVDDHVYDLLHGETNLPENEEKTNEEEREESEELERLQHDNVNTKNNMVTNQNNVMPNKIANSNNNTAIINNNTNNAMMPNNNIAHLNNNTNTTNNNIGKQNVNNISPQPILN